MDIDPIDQAIYETVHGYRDRHTGKKGAGALAKLIGISPSSLQNKANRNEDFAHLHVRESRAIMLATEDFTILRALAAEVNHAVMPLPAIEFPGDFDLAVAMAEWTQDFGETAAEIKVALNNKKITQKEIKEIKRELSEDFEKGLALLDVLKGMAEPE